MEVEVRYYYSLNEESRLLEKLNTFEELNYLGKFYEKTIQYNHPMRENDFYSKEIDGRFRVRMTEKDNIKKCGKKVVLVFEDMDRIDPAHLFRIMNVLSAQIDYPYRLGMPTDESLIGNKFDVDNVVMVLDYRNLENIFHHFYGANTDCKG